MSGMIIKIKGSTDIRQLGDIYNDHPRIALLFAISLFSVIGIPPLSGFWPKISLIWGGIEKSDYLSVGFILFGSFITLMAVARIWSKVFWKSSTVTAPPNAPLFFDQLSKRRRFWILFPVGFLSVVTLYIGFGADNIHLIASRIAEDLINVDAYIELVLGK